MSAPTAIGRAPKKDKLGRGAGTATGTATGPFGPVLDCKRRSKAAISRATRPQPMPSKQWLFLLVCGLVWRATHAMCFSTLYVGTARCVLTGHCNGDAADAVQRVAGWGCWCWMGWIGGRGRGEMCSLVHRAPRSCIWSVWGSPARACGASSGGARSPSRKEITASRVGTRNFRGGFFLVRN